MPGDLICPSYLSSFPIPSYPRPSLLSLSHFLLSLLSTPLSFPPLPSIYYLSQRRAWFTSWSTSWSTCTISESKKSRSKSKPQSACLKGAQLIMTIRRGCSPPMSERRRPLRYLSLFLCDLINTLSAGEHSIFYDLAFDLFTIPLTRYFRR